MHGPPVETGFYYDLEMPHRISQEDFARIEEEMKKEIKANNVSRRSKCRANRPSRTRKAAGSAD